MKTQEALKKYFAKRREAIGSLLRKPARKFTTENFHQLRVEIKKLNAFCSLINYKSKDFKRRKTFKPLKHIFKQAGILREIQLEEIVLKKYNFQSSLKVYLSRLKKMLAKERKIFFSIPTKKFQSDVNKAFEEIAAFIKTTGKKKTNRYIAGKQEKIEKLIHQKTLKAKEVHELRKRLKEYYYNLKSVNLKLQVDKVKQADDLQELLGKWHDYQIMIKDLGKAINANGMNEKEVLRLEMIKTKLASDSELLFGKINEGIHRTKILLT